MTTASKALLIALAALAVAGGMMHLFLPDGLPGLVNRLAAPDRRPPPTQQRTAPAPGGDAAVPAESKLKLGDAAYDAGDFGRAVDHYLAARLEGAAADQDRAQRSLNRAILAWALVWNVPTPTPLPDDPDAEIAARQATADKSGTEAAWFDLAMFAAGCGSARRLPAITQEAIDRALPNGPVERRLLGVLGESGSRAGPLRTALIARGFLSGAPADPLAAGGGGGKPRTPAKKPIRRTVDPPGGKFTPATKAKLAEAADFESRGAAEYDLAGPDMPNRKEHRRNALDLLVKAREIYDIAYEEDSTSPSLDRRLHDTFEMISHLRKEMNLGD